MSKSLMQSPVRLFAVVGAALVALALVSPVNHDETQYIAAARLASEGRVPYRDFLYLQTPYQVFVFAPLWNLFGQAGFLAVRALTGLIGAGVLALAHAAQRAAGVEARRAGLCALLMALSYTFIFCVSVVRNDALPAALLTGAILVAVRGPVRASSWALGGVLLGLAAGTKISFLAPALAFAGFPAWAWLVRAIAFRTAVSGALAAAAGLVAALLPLLWFREIAPVAFDYGNFGYHAEAPLAWYAANGLEDRLTLAAKARDVALTLVRGPALFALVVYGWLRLGSIRERRSHGVPILLMDVLILAGLAATVAPTPTWRQYAMPLLPPLFVGLGLVWQEWAQRRAQERGARVPGPVRHAMALAALVGLFHAIVPAWQGLSGARANPITIAREGAFLAHEAAARGLTGPSASLSPEVVLASGLPLDPTFATGPFAYRTAALIPPDMRAAMRVTSPGSVATHFRANPPDTIVTGYENFDHVDALGLEQPIEAFAEAEGYDRIESPHGDAVLWFRQ